jgi:uncharacterized membrane protein
MTDTETPAPAATDVVSAGAAAESLTVPTVVYVLYGIGFFFAPTAVVGVIMAHTGAATAGPVSRTHFRYQTRTFWYGLLTLAIAAALVMAFAGVVFVDAFMSTSGGGNYRFPDSFPPVLVLAGAVFFWWFIWTIVRCIKGFVTVLGREPMPNPTTLLW